MTNWDDESEEEQQAKPALVVPSRKFEGEDEEEEVADDWEASSDEEAKAPPPQPVAPARKKASLKARIAEREAEKARRLAEDEDKDEESVADEGEQRRRDKEQQLEIDLANASSLLSISAKSLPTEIQELVAFNPKTKEDFEAYSKKIFEAFIKKHQEKPLYAAFVEMHVKALAQPMRDVDVRKAASGLTTLANEKQKEQRDKSSGKKKTKGAAKPALAGTRALSRADTVAYEDALDDFGNDDFM